MSSTIDDTFRTVMTNAVSQVIRKPFRFINGMDWNSILSVSGQWTHKRALNLIMEFGYLRVKNSDHSQRFWNNPEIRLSPNQWNSWIEKNEFFAESFSLRISYDRKNWLFRYTFEEISLCGLIKRSEHFFTFRKKESEVSAFTNDLVSHLIGIIS